MATYFQQEMTSLMRFQAAYNINVPFFISFSGRWLQPPSDDYSSLYYQFYGYGTEGWQKKPPDSLNRYDKSNMEMAVVTGIQFKFSQSVYMPILFCFEMADTASTYLREIAYKGTAVKEPFTVRAANLGMFLGSGLFINTDVIKGGIYMGWGYAEHQIYGDSPSLYSVMREHGIRINAEYEFKYYAYGDSFKIALVPLVNTSEWKYIGKVLDNILGYFGLGDALMNLAETEGDSKWISAASAINAALDFSFNRIHWGNLSLDMQAMYTRGNFDSAAKADTYGAKLTGLFSGKHFGFSLEGGYKHFASFASPAEYFAQGYPGGTGYFNGSVYFPFKHVTFGVIYQYDAVYESRFGIALSSNTFSGLGLCGKVGEVFLPLGNWGLRFRWGGWNAGRSK